MAIEILEDSIRYAAKTKIKDLALTVAQTKNLAKVKEEIKLGKKIFKFCQALDYGDYLSKNTRDRIVRALVDIAGINKLPVAPYLGNIDPPTISNQGARGATGETGADGAEGGGVPFSATAVTIDTICDSFPVTDSRGVEYTINIYDDAGSGMRVMRLQAGWDADGSNYADDGGIGTTILGDTSGVSMSVIVSGTTVQLFATVTSGEWTIEGTRKYVPNNGNGIVNPTTLAEGRIWVGNSSNSPTAVTPSGDITITTAGVTAIGSGVIVNADISGTAAIAASKLAAVTASRALVSDGSGFMTVSATTATQVGYLSTTTSDVQIQLDSKISSASGAISTVVSTDLTASRAVIANPSGKIAVSATTSTELGYVSGATSNLQTQINSRVADTGDTMTGALVNTSTIEAQGGIRTASSGDYIKTKIIDIGDWDISSDISIDVAHGLTLANIRTVNFTIRNDAGTLFLPNNSFYAVQNTPRITEVNATNVALSGTTALQTTDWDATSYNRGWVTIQYV